MEKTFSLVLQEIPVYTSSDGKTNKKGNKNKLLANNRMVNIIILFLCKYVHPILIIKITFSYKKIQAVMLCHLWFFNILYHACWNAIWTNQDYALVNVISNIDYANSIYN